MQERHDLFRAPLADALLAVGRDVRRVPAIDLAALELTAPVRGAEQVVVVVAFAAVAQALDEIGAAVDLLALVGIGHEGRRLEERRPPGQQRLPDVEREHEFERLAWRVLGRQREKVGLDGQDILALHLREPGERKHRVEVLAAVADALVQGAVELVVAPVPDARGLIRRDIGRGDGAERGRHRQPSGIRLAARRAVTGDAVTGPRQVLALFDQGLVRVIGSRGVRRGCQHDQGESAQGKPDSHKTPLA